MPFTAADVSHLAEILAQAGKQEVLPRFKALRAGDVRTKTSVFDPVTEADEASERMITAALLARFPDALVVGEEATAADPALLDRLADVPLAFTVDPIDGTRNFIAGLPLFGVMASVIVHGDVVAGVIHDPICGDTAQAYRGEGAWLHRPDQAPLRLRVAAPAPLGKIEAITGTNYLPEPLRSRVINNLPRLGSTTWLRCSAHEYRLAAGGFCHVLFYNRLMPWDHAPGWIIHQEAGGYSAHFDGSAYSPANRTGGLICAPDRAMWQLVRDTLLNEPA